MDPAACVIAYALPTSEQEFGEKSRAGSDYVSAFAGGWPQYRATCDLMRLSIDTCRRHRATVLERLTAAQLDSLFLFDTVILFAHSVDQDVCSGARSSPGGIELWDRYVGDSEMVAAVPEGYQGTIDLCACHPIALVQALKAQRRSASVKYEPNLLLPGIWAEIYATVFRFATEPTFADMPYVELLETVVTEYRRQADSKDCVRFHR